MGNSLKLVNVLPRSSLLYRFCRRYVAHYNGENNEDMQSNGEFRWLREVIPQCKVVFDVGANVGDWTGLALGVNPQLRVHCFEPSITAFQRLQSRSFPAEQVLLNRCGLGATEGEMALYLFSAESGLSSLYPRKGIGKSQTRIEHVRMDTLDSYCQRRGVDHIDLLKLDVEGHELRVLEGSASMLAGGRVRRIQFEYGGTYIDARVLLKDMFDLLTSYGYQLSKIYPRGLRPFKGYHQTLENFQYQNWVAELDREKARRAGQ